MSHKNKPTLIDQSKECLQSVLKIGEKKHAYKDDDDTYKKYIFSWNTYHEYLKHSIYFTNYCHHEHGCKTLEECRQYVDEWLTLRSELSPYTVKLEANALAKLYGCSTTDFIKTPDRKRADITRSRGEAERDKHFSEARNSEFVSFCRSTGLRRHEIENLHGTDLVKDGDRYYIHVRKGKGGKERYALVIGDVENVVSLMTAAGDGKVFKRVPEADIHGYRREYAQAYYDMIARPLETLSHDEKYFCRQDKRGIVYDRRAMLIVSRSLGHNRIDVIANNYLD